MKKVLSLVLALAMVVGMSSVAFAADTVVPSVTAGTLDQKTGEQTLTITIPAKYATDLVGRAYNNEALDVRGLDTNTSARIEEIEEFLNLTAATVTSKDLTGGSVTLTLKLSTEKGSTYNRYLPTGNYSIYLKFSLGGGNTLAIDNVMFSVKGTGTDAADTVPSTYKITGIADNWTDFVDWSSAGDLSAKFEKVTADSTFLFPLYAGMFTWEDQDGHDIVYATGRDGDAKTKVRTTHLKNIGIRKTNTINNSGTVKSLEIDGTNVKLKTVTYFLKCGDTDVSLDMDLTYKSNASGDKLYISFNIYNEEILVESGTEWVDTDSHVYVKADETVRNLELRIGEGLSLYKGMGSGQKAYARVSLELSAGDEKLFQQYSELSDVYTLYTVGVASANVYAEFTDLDDTYFVYDENFKLLGTTADSKLPFSNKYYLTTKKVDLAGTASSEEPADESSEPTPGDTGNAVTGGGTAVVSNYNPNTGA